MAMQQCPNGHLYDSDQHSSCPFCGNSNTMNRTVPLTDSSASNPGISFPETMDIDRENVNEQKSKIESVIGATVPITPGFAQTMYVNQNESEVPKVRGWLICLEGEKMGTDFRVHGEKNTIGRGPENDIKLDFDYTISKGTNATIAYDNRNNKFYLYQSESKNNIYFNEQLLLTPVELKDYDVIEIGKTKMIFRSLCNDTFVWKDEDSKDKK